MSKRVEQFIPVTGIDKSIANNPDRCIDNPNRLRLSLSYTTGGVNYFSGEVPTPAGPIRICWSNADHRLEIHHPASLTPQVDITYLPNSKAVITKHP